MGGILVFLSVFSISLLLIKIKKDIKLAYALLTSFCLHILLSYIFVYLFGSYQIAPYLIVFIPVLAFFYFLFERKTLASVLKSDKIIFVLYIIFSIILLIILHNQYLWYSDEATFWARAVKELHTLESSYFSPFSNMNHRDYYPALIPLQYVYTKIFGYTQSTLYYINALSILTSLLAIVQTFKNKTLFKGVAFISLSVICLSVGYPTLSINSLLIDVQLAVLFVTALIVLFLSDRKGGYLYPVAAVSFLIIFLKSFTGLMFCAIILIAILFSKIILKTDIPKKFICICFAIAILFQSSWSMYYALGSNNHAYEKAVMQNEIFSSGVEVPQASLGISNLIFTNPRTASIANTLSGNADMSSISLVSDSLDILFFQKLQNANTSAFIVTACLLILLAVFCVYNRKHKYVLSFFVFCLASCLVYFAGIMFTYLIQPEIISSLLRYYGVVIVVLIITLFKFSFDTDAPFKTIHKVIALTFLCCIVFNPIQLVNNIISPAENDNFKVHEEIKEDMSQYLKRDENTLLIYGVEDNALGANLSISTSAECEYFLSEYKTSILFRNESSHDTSIDLDFLNYHTQNTMSTRIVMNFLTQEYIGIVSEQINIDPTTKMPWVFEVENVNGEIQYTLLG